MEYVSHRQTCGLVDQTQGLPSYQWSAKNNFDWTFSRFFCLTVLCLPYVTQYFWIYLLPFTIPENIYFHSILCWSKAIWKNFSLAGVFVKYWERVALSLSVQTSGLFGSNIVLSFFWIFALNPAQYCKTRIFGTNISEQKAAFHILSFRGVGEILTKSGFIFLRPDNRNRWRAQFIAINVISQNLKWEINDFEMVMVI